MELLLQRLINDVTLFEPKINYELPVLAFMQNGDEKVLHGYCNDPLYAILSQALFPVHTPKESEHFQRLDLSLNQLGDFALCNKCLFSYQELHSSIIDFELQMAIGAKTLLEPMSKGRSAITAQISSKDEARAIVKAYLEFRDQIMQELLFYTDVLVKDSYIKLIEKEREKVGEFFESIVYQDLIKALPLFLDEDCLKGESYLVKLGAICDVLNLGGEDFILDDAPLIVTLLGAKSFDEEIIIPVSSKVFNLLESYENEMGYRGLGLLLDSCKLGYEYSSPLISEIALVLHKDGGEAVNTLEKAFQVAELILKK